MSSTFVSESKEEKDDSLIIIVNPDGTITVDPDTLQKLIGSKNNQHTGNVSVIKVDEDECTNYEEQTITDNSHVNLSVEGFYSDPPEPAMTDIREADPGNTDVVVDTFSQMDPEHIARLESALQSDQAKEILGHKLGENLNEMLNILELNEDKPLPHSEPIEETRSEPTVHNDHSYVTVAPYPTQTTTTPPTTSSILNRPLMRGGRARIRGGLGRIMTRGGILRTTPVISTQSTTQSPMVTTVAVPKTIPKTMIISQSGRLVPQPFPGDKKKDVPVSPRAIALSANKIIVKSDEQKKTFARGGKVAVRMPKMKKIAKIIDPSQRSTSTDENEKLKKELEDEMPDIPIPKIDPTIPNADKKLTFQQVVTLLKKKPSVVVQKLPPKVNETSPPKHNVKPKKDIKIGIKSPTKVDTPTPSPTVTSPKAPKQIEDETKKKKDKIKGTTPTTPIVLGPELFSTPDIIRRVSTDKNAVNDTPEVMPPPQTPPVEKQPPKTEQEMPKVQVQPLHPPIITTKCGEEMSAESLLDSIHAEVAKDESRFLAMFDELNDDDTMGDIKMIDTNIEETLEQMEIGDDKPLETSIDLPIENDSNIESNLLTPLRKLPPIELPTTRSAAKKAAQVHSPEDSHKDKIQKVVKVEKRDTERKTSVDKKSAPKSDESEFESGDESVNSEDDPDRLWCICKRPHNNRFMICCDSCEEWFHGKCVGITKALGQTMEQQGVEWTCPNCKEAKKNATMNRLKSEATVPQKIIAKNKPPGQQVISSLECIICKKPAKATSNYCSDICVKKHVLIMLAMLKKETVGLNPSTRVVVYEKSSGRLLSGEKAPTVVTLAEWLMAHKTFEVIKPSILPHDKYYKYVSPKPTTPSVKPVEIKTQKTQVQLKLSSSLNKQIVVEKPQVKTPTGSKTVVQTLKTSVKSPNLIQKQIPIQKNIDVKNNPKLVQKNTPQKAIVIQPQPQTPTVPKPKEDGEKSRRKSQPMPASPSPSQEKKKDDKIEVKSVKKPKSKEVESKPSTSSKQDEPVKHHPEPVRANVKRTLHELLLQRVQQDTTLNIPVEEIKLLVNSIEEELFNLFKDTGAKYKSKYRSLVFNIKDVKNLTLYKKIVEKSVSPSQLVRLSPEELASQELAQWREKEAKHQIEIIKKNELDLIHQAKTVVLKSRKGEEVIESKNHEANITELESALNRTADDEEIGMPKQDKKDDILSILSSIEKKKKEEKDDKKKDKRKDRKRSRRSRSRSKRSRSKERRSSRSISKDEKEKRSRSISKDSKSSQSKHRSKSRDRKKSESKSDVLEETKQVLIPASEIKVEERSLTPPPPPEKKLKEDDLSDREPSSTVTINTPPYVDEKPPFWSGILNMSEVTKLYASAYEVSGSCEDLGVEMSSNLECVGRIQPDAVWDYVSRMKKAGTKDIIVIRFQSDSEEEKMNYLSLYSYLNSRNRMAVIGSVSKAVKDFYVLPLASHSPIPQVLLPLDGPGFDDYRPHLLLGIIIKTKKGSSSLPSFSTQLPKKKTHSSKIGERSYTPPLPGDGSTTPPLPPSSSIKRLPLRGFTPPIPDLDDEPYSPGEDDPYSPGDIEEDSIIVKPNPEIQRNLEEVNRMIEEKRQKIEIMTSAAALPQRAIPGLNNAYNEDEDEAYSPSERLTPPSTAESIPFFDSKSLPDIKLPSNLQEILASIKGPDMNGQRSKDVSSDPIVKAYSSGYLEDDDDKSEDERSEPVHEKTSRDPRQREKIHPKTSLSQLSDAELIRKAAEMEEAKQEIYYKIPPPLPQYTQLPFTKVPPPPLPVPLPVPMPSVSTPLRKRKEYTPPKEYSHKEIDAPKYPYKEDYRKNRKWERPPMGNGSHRGTGPPRMHRGSMNNGGGFRRGFDRGRGVFRGRFGQHRGMNFRGHPPRHKFDGVQSEWDEEIRNFEQRKLDRDRRKRRPSRSPSPSRRRRRRSSSGSS